jgi:uncharacterized protein (DUF2141 family)
MSIVLLLGLLGALSAAPQTFVLETPENVWDVAALEIDSGRSRSVFVLCCDEKSYPLRKALCVYAADDTGTYAPKPVFTIALEPSVSTLFFAEVDGQAPKELVAADAAGATIYGFRNGSHEALGTPRFSSLLPNNSKEPIFLKDAAKDLDGDGIDEWLIPVPTGVEVRTPKEALASVSCDVVSEIHHGESTYIIHRLPACQPFDLTDSPQKGLAFLSDEFADFAYGAQWVERERFRIPVNLEEKWEASAKMADVDGNGFPDLMVTQTRGTINLRTQTQIYVSTAPFKYPETPTATYLSKGAIASPVMRDVDGDKKLDVVLISIPFGLKNFVNFFVRGKISVDAAVYLFNGKDFGSAPAFSTSLTMDAPEGREQVAYAMDDFNGDGRLDMAFGQADDVFVVHTGEPERFVSAKPWARLSLPSFGQARPVDLNSNPAKDLLIFHPGGGNSKRVEVILF